MPRPKRIRRIQAKPNIKHFGPDGITCGEYITLSHEEYEAIRLIDHLGLDQSQASDIMGVSRQTVGRILKEGRFKLSSAIVEARRLKVDGGCYRVRKHPLENTGPGQLTSGNPDSCRGKGRGKRHGRGCPNSNFPGKTNP